MPEALAFFRGQVVPLSEAKVSVTTHALHYGTAVFEGIRGNWNAEQDKLYVFRMREHYERLIQGMPHYDDGHSLQCGRSVRHHARPLAAVRVQGGPVHPAAGVQERGAGGEPEAAGVEQRLHADGSAVRGVHRGGWGDPVLHFFLEAGGRHDHPAAREDFRALCEQHTGEDGGDAVRLR